MDGGKTDNLRRTTRSRDGIDDMDRKILGALAVDATVSLSALGSAVGLSAPAVHERVKRLRATGVIRGTVAVLDGTQVGRPILAFVHVDTKGWGKTQPMIALTSLPEVEELHSVTGDTCVILKVRVASAQALEGLLARIYDIDGVQSTRSYMVLSTHLERTPQAGITGDLYDGPIIR
ncbi:MAG: Lrp/AsnC family transcriptional regulator [Pseudomonadota bacterium]